ncbi:polyphosphate polymerase domain-containing protein [Dysgonomonas sp. 520]|uniref:polyphosphate polymerase domain-containing protein n=1 Tax=Dysgonomonas sp. 520 TaxID=2302931 RepID=UPI0013D2F712|nr:polyphosphate polymerase domain-containing protein [Dysgonomonas sp. 520]NDW08555.1 VTC domain-containing protein [Dysgonomonas sp. 520]
MTRLADLKLNSFDSISLSQMEDIRLMKRIDKKFVLPLNLLPQLLDRLTVDYDIQEIDGKRSFGYATLYYDTADYEMYRAHQNGKLNRLKVRTREYVDSNLCFLEIKRKSNKGITKKIRISRKTHESIQEEESSSFLSSNSPYCSRSLEGKLWSLYQRITLVNKEKTERLTIDHSLCFRNRYTGKSISLPELVIIEIKKNQSSYSPVMNSLNQLRIRPKGMSKYCLGVALTENPEKVKKNLFKAKLLGINKITPFQYE